MLMQDLSEACVRRIEEQPRRMTRIDQVASIIRSIGWVDHTSIISFPRQIPPAHEEAPPRISRLYLLSEKLDEKVLEFCEKHGIHLDVKHDQLDEASIKRLHLIGLKTAVWTVDDKDTAERLIKLGVDYHHVKHPGVSR
ncbi:MAG: hypothetical protein MZU97_19425 [Bacillus subtilis]|nr:hypothetical protein [Bacillus subtilis]